MFADSPQQAQRAMAKLTLMDGKSMVASVKLSMSGKLSEAFNGPERFVDVITGDGQSMMINKSSIARAEAWEPPKAELNQRRRSSDKASFNPHLILGVEKTAGMEDIRARYITLVKAYHPDRFSALDLPQEMKDYAAAMQARINMAYQMLES
jgi:hypothetical protein